MRPNPPRTTYSVGLETNGNPQGFGDGSVMFVTVTEGVDPQESLLYAVKRLADRVTFEDGHRIVVRQTHPCPKSDE